MSVVGWKVLAAAWLLLLGGCAAASSDPVPPSAGEAAAAITVSVGPCFGFCPVYEVTIASDGGVAFVGSRHTAVLGEHRRRAPAQTYRALAADLARFRPADGSATAVACGAAVSDTPSYVITWKQRGHRPAIATHQGGCPAGAGYDLDAVLRELPPRLGIDDWARQTTRPGVPRG